MSASCASKVALLTPDFEDVYLFGDLFDDLVDCFFIFVDCYCHSSYVWLLGWSNGDAFDVKVSAAEKVGDEVQNSWLVFYQDAYDFGFSSFH
jgi:hypothetical protein